MVTIRTARPSDAPMIARCNSLLASETESIALDPAVLDRGVRAVLDDATKGTYFLAEVEERVVGQLMITREWSDWRDGDIWWIQSVYVEPEFRGRGVFRALYEHVRDEARRAGAVGLRLYVHDSNSAAQRTYARLGMSLSHYKVMEEMFGGAGD